MEIFDIDDTSYGKLKWYAGSDSLDSIAAEEGLEISDNYRGKHNKK